MRIALLHNPRPAAIPSGLPDDCFEEYDGAETVEAIAGALRGLGVYVEPVVADRGCARALEDGGFDFVFNIAEGNGRRNREAVPAAVCELLGLPYTGSDPLTLALTLDKWAARRMVSPEVPVARGVLLRGDCDGLQGLRYPVMVKPNDEGSSKGIRADSVVMSLDDARVRSQRLMADYGCPVLVEEFLPGAEITVGVMGNGARARVLAAMEIAPVDDAAPFVYSLEVKRDFARRVRYHVPPRVSDEVRARVERMALDAYALLGCRDVARMDFRLDGDGAPCFLECNPLPGLNPESGDLVILSRGLMEYDALVQGILLEALGRTGVRLG
ncbi:MAG: D-alanine--D-alanine ligase [Acidobacteria bacterium]|nr:D-alanine--D-alanine ligase [Acidobacteriota bacterium]